MVAMEVGVQLVFDAQVLQPGHVPTLTGGSLSLTVLNLVNGRRASYPASVGTAATILGTAYATGAYGSYTTTGVEFPVAGAYQLQLVASFGGGTQVYKSPPQSINVDIAL